VGYERGVNKKLIEWAEWANNNAHNCPNCKITTRNGEQWSEERCKTCRVVLMEENADAAFIYNLCRGQVIVAFDKVIDLNHLAVWKNIEKFKIKNDADCFLKVNRVFRHFLNEGSDAS
jgi:hypothetical protein